MVEPGDVVTGDLENGGEGESDQRRISANPAKPGGQRKVPGERGDAGEQQRHKDAKPARGAQSHAHTKAQ